MTEPSSLEGAHIGPRARGYRVQLGTSKGPETTQAIPRTRGNPSIARAAARIAGQQQAAGRRRRTNLAGAAAAAGLGLSAITAAVIIGQASDDRPSSRTSMVVDLDTAGDGAPGTLQLAVVGLKDGQVAIALQGSAVRGEPTLDFDLQDTTTDGATGLVESPAVGDIASGRTGSFFLLDGALLAKAGSSAAVDVYVTHKGEVENFARAEVTVDKVRDGMPQVVVNVIDPKGTSDLATKTQYAWLKPQADLSSLTTKAFGLQL